MSLDVTGLRAAHDITPVLHGVDLHLAGGEAIGLVGRNGVGKTSFANTLTGLLRTTGGRIDFLGEDITGLSATKRGRRGIAYIGQDSAVFPTLTVLENLMVGISTWRRSEAEQKALAVVDELFPALRQRLTHAGFELSGGQRRLVELARVMLRRPKLLVLDEPTEGVQPSFVQDLLDRLIQLKHDSGLSVIVIEHRLDFVAALADTVSVMVKGQIVTTVPADQLLTDDELHRRYLAV
ncbi:ABC transporter ATP-binding protein [Nonomuraea deserti]|uniref:ABC transporter ATP-binding protein n=1 Tax=Nonomuraea deserti TaxID=1848322 RepID=UPI001404DD14|nr:ATP-binding cassette domain-containing protein [Nonomuraea deserti]